MRDFYPHTDPRDASYMRLALDEASKAAAEGEVPVGAVVVCENEIIGRSHNRREELRSALAHAEVLAIEQSSRHLGRWRLSDCQLYVTLEPCVMCVGAIVQARIGRLVFGCLDPKGGAVESLYQLCDDSRLNHRLPVVGGMLAADCSAILEGFFNRLRRKQRDETKAERWPSPAEGA
ncbi:MAG TPA: tRNA adenosine(34) deaminase TadA [Candidatus Binatia bacterium]|nr:tRNA adenosine(34) deaminase TadA [Candidatus Binatia bacterium]